MVRKTYCDECPLRGSPCVSSVGSDTAKIAVVGRNPGRQEARTGVPFTGPSGQLLDATLEELHMKRDDLYIANAVNCHWPEDSGPPPEAYDACHSRLMEELRVLKPAIILSLGNEGTQAILGRKIGGVMSLVGSMHPFTQPWSTHTDANGTPLEPTHKAWCIPTFHPAYILRGHPEGYHDFAEAVERAKGLAEGSRPMPQPLPYDKVQYFDTEQYVLDGIAWVHTFAQRTLAIDTETERVRDPYRQLLTVQMSDGKDAWVFEAKYLIKGKAREIFIEMLKDPSYTWIFHNASFDLQYIMHHFGVVPEHIEDSLALALCLSEELWHCGLKRLVNTYLSVPHYEAELKQYLKKGDGYSVIPREVLVPYAGFDVIFTYRLLPILKERVKAAGNYKLYPFLLDLQVLFAEMAFTGVEVDREYVESLKEEYEPLIYRLELEIQAYAMMRGFKAQEVVKNAEWPFMNVKSSAQLKYFLNKYCGFETKTTNRRFMEANEGHEFIDRVFRYRRIEHLVKSHIYGLEEEVWPDGRVHPDFVNGTVTGRITITHPALQIQPTDAFSIEYNVKPIRRMFVATKGYKFLHADYSQLEIRVAWHITGDTALGEAVMTKDLHRTMAGMVYNKPADEVTGHERAMSKMITFGMLYGRGALSISKQMRRPVEDAQGFLDQFAARFPTYYAWWTGVQKEALEKGYIENEFGRRRHWDIITPDNMHEIMRQAVNYPIQSTASDICLTSLIKINKELKARDWGRAIFCVHDSVELEVRDEVVDEALELVQEMMIHPFPQSCAIFKVKAGVGSNYHDASKD